MDQLVYISNKAMLLVVVLSAAPIIVATVVGLIVGLIQTVTQLQEQTLPFGLKLLAVFLCLFLFSGWISDKLISFSVEVLQIAINSDG